MMKFFCAIGVGLLLCGCSLNPKKARDKYLEGGRDLMKKGEYAAAIAQFRNAAGQDPKSVDAVHLLGQAYVASRQPKEAYVALNRAVEIDPNRIDLRTMLAGLCLDVRELKRAEEHARFVIAREPGNGAAWQVLGRALAANKDDEGARAALAKAVELSPKDPSALVYFGRLLAASGDLPAAEQKLRAATEMDPRHTVASLALADFYRSRQRSADAEKALQHAMDQNPNEIGLYLATADLLLGEGKTVALDALLGKLRERHRKAETGVALGDLFVTRNQRERAVAEFRWALELAPTNLLIKARLVELYLGAGKLDEAERLNDEILSSQPKNVHAGISRGRILLGRNQRREAITVLLQQASRAKDSAEARFYLAEAYSRNGSPSDAKSEYQEALRLAPNLLPAHLGLGNAQVALGLLPAARATAESAVAAFPKAAPARLLLGKILLAQHDAASAQQHLLIARQVAPDNPDVLVALALTYAAKKDWLNAEKEIEAALKLQPRHPEAIAQLSGIWIEAGQPEKAIARLRQHVASHPDDVHSHMMLGSVYGHVRDFTNAQSALDRAVALAPNLLLPRTQLASVYRDQGRFDEAVKQYEAALRLEPNSSRLYVFLGIAQYQRGDREAARASFDRAVTLDPNSSLAANNLAAANAELGRNLDDALTLARKARELDPNLIEAADTVAWIQYKKGWYQSAAPLLEDCVRRAPESAAFQYHLGMVLAASGEKDRARTHLEKALRLRLQDAEALEARNALARIR